MPRAARSSLTDHRFPPFYACYLLKSIRTPRATATYIGSTPSPPRRIRQHNGEISQGAWKTKHNRPWVMQMIVHGFPSKLAALQFEWAWQHPHISRHLRDDDGKAMFNSSGRFKYLNTNVKVARSMLSSHPYNTWPLRVKLFTEEAAKIWNNSAKDTSIPPLPEGLEVSLELEGVDGKSGKPGSGRTVPIDVVDAHFTTAHVQKASAVFTPESRLRCSICHEVISHDTVNQDPLVAALCPTSGCTAVSHLTCLSRDFLATTPSTSSDIIPRGGTCKECHSYVLWGDVIRGCYRRRQGGVTPEAELEEADDQEDPLGQLFDEGDGEDEPDGPAAKHAKVAAPRPTKAAKRPRGRPPSASKPASFSTVASSHTSDGEREHFDLDAISSCSEEDSADDLPWTRKRPQSKPSSHTKHVSPNVPVPTRGVHPTTGTDLRPACPNAAHTARGPDHDAPQISPLLTSCATDATVEDHGAPSAGNAAAGPSRFVRGSADCFYLVV
ncbi:hypothetical protein C8Q77DRAFT_1056180 [Trametes polyzona]|nr:hypothetical protein C8Q77DRAFT_1056180 [Trametes polyzona]